MVSGYAENVRLKATAEANQTNVPLKLTIASGAGDNSASTIYLNNKALNWPYDIRFTNESGDELDFWRQESDSEDGTWWILIDSLIAKEISYIYLHYGKAGDSDADSGPGGIVTFYDDFETGDLSEWTTVGAAWSAQSSVKYEGSYAAKATGGAAGAFLEKTISPGSSIVIDFRVRTSDPYPIYFHRWDPIVLVTAGAKVIFPLGAAIGSWFFDHTMNVYIPNAPKWDYDTWYHVKIIIDNASQKVGWEIDGFFVGYADLVDTSDNPIGVSDFVVSLKSQASDYANADGYLDQLIVYPYKFSKWLSPETEEALEDGLYVIERGIDYSLKPEETLRAMAYNDHALDFIMSKGKKFGPAASTYDLTVGCLQDDVKHGACAHYVSGEIKVKFAVGGISDIGKTVVDVTVAAFVSGRARTILEYDEVDYYGTLSTKKHVAAWLETVYTTIPGTSDPWTFTDLGRYPIAGVDIRKTSDVEFPYTFGSESDPYEIWDEWDTLPSMYVVDTTCYCIKLLVHYYLNSDPSTILELEWLPFMMDGYTGRLSVVQQNIINNGDIVGWPIFHFIGEVVSFAGEVFKKFQPEYLSYVDGGFVRYKVDVSDWVGTYYWQWRAYIRINGTKYYKSYTTGSDIVEWATNPATSAAWKDGDLDEDDGCGIEIINIYSGPNWIYPRIYDPFPTIVSSDETEYDMFYGDLECTPGLWIVTSDTLSNHYEYFTNDMWYCNLVGDMYPYEGDRIQTEELSKRFESDLSKIPPSFSQINGFRVTASMFAWSDVPDDSYWRIFINVDGTRYYSDEYTMVGHPNLAKEETYSWDTNPATSAAWTYDELQGIMYGVEVTRSSVYDQVIFRPYELYADIDYQAIKGPLAPVYHKLPVISSTINLTKNSNTPKFKADELRCVLPVGYYQPERTEIILAQGGAHVFHGFVWQADQRPNKETQILAKAQSHALACRYIPNFFYHARNSRWMSVYSLDEVFSDDVPIYPNEFGWLAYSPGGSHEYQRWGNYYLDERDPIMTYPGSFPLIYFLAGTYSNVGIFFLLNSMIPYGYAGDTDRYRDVAELSFNRAKFLMSHNPSNIPKVENLGLCILDTNRNDWGWDGTDPTILETISDIDPTNISDPVGGIKRFRQGDSETLFYDEYAYSGKDLLVSHYPGVFMVLFDHALDTYLRPGKFELEDKYLAVPYVFNGSYASAFGDFFFRLGQEVWFRNAATGYVYMDTASELGRSATLQFMDGKNSIVTKSVRDPAPAAVIGNDTQSKLSTDWAPVRTWLTKIETTQRMGEDLQEWLDLRRDEDKSTWTIKTLDKHWHILPGDHVFARARGQGLEDVRVRKAVINNAGTTLTCGKRLYDLSEEWGQWRSVRGSTDADTDMPVQEQEIDLGDADGSQTFIIKAEEYEIGSWKCKLTINWDLDVDEGYTADLASAPLGMFLVVKLNTKVVPPGRIRARGNSGNVELDLTDYCTCSTSSDETNTVAIKLWRAVSSTHYRHKITGAITQYRRLEAVDNA